MLISQPQGHPPILTDADRERFSSLTVSNERSVLQGKRVKKKGTASSSKTKSKMPKTKSKAADSCAKSPPPTNGTVMWVVNGFEDLRPKTWGGPFPSEADAYQWKISYKDDDNPAQFYEFAKCLANTPSGAYRFYHVSIISCVCPSCCSKGVSQAELLSLTTKRMMRWIILRHGKMIVRRRARRILHRWWMASGWVFNRSLQWAEILTIVDQRLHGLLCFWCMDFLTWAFLQIFKKPKRAARPVSSFVWMHR